MMPRLAIVVPCYNEEEVLPETARRLGNVLTAMIQATKITPHSFIYLVDDGSRDHTWSIIQTMSQADSHIKGIKLSRNFGHQNALMAGMLGVLHHCDCVVTIDADLQQDEQAIWHFVQAYTEGNELVLGIRNSRLTDGWFKRTSATAFYRLMNFLGSDVVPHHADYRLLGKRALTALAEYREHNLFLRGLVLQLGFQTAIVPFEVRSRLAGDSKYSLSRMISFSWKGITSFSLAPLRLVIFLGLLTLLFSIIMSCYVVYQYAMGHVVPGWSSTVLPIYILGGVQILSIGIVGEYLGRLYSEIKGRPRYHIDRDHLAEDKPEQAP